MTRRAVLVSAVVGLLLACGGQSGGSSPAVPPAPSPNEVAPASTPAQVVVPQRASPSSCAVMLRIDTKPIPDGRQVVVSAENLGADAVAFDLPDRCPNGLISLEGLGATYDYYGTCNAGVCTGSPHPRRIELGPRESKSIATTKIAFAGAPPCTTTLAPGRHALRAILPTSSVTFCSADAIFEVPPPAPISPSVPIAPPSQPAVALNPDDPLACASDADCVLSCPTASGCCGWPCGCRNVINRMHVTSFEASYAKTCTKIPHCPVVGCAYEPAMSAACVRGRCMAAKGLGLGSHESNHPLVKAPLAE